MLEGKAKEAAIKAFMLRSSQYYESFDVAHLQEMFALDAQ